MATTPLVARVAKVVAGVAVDVDCCVRATAAEAALSARDAQRAARETGPVSWREIVTAVADRGQFSVPLYEHLDATTELDEVHVVDKAVLRERAGTLLNQRAISGSLWVKATSGTTGTPVDVVFDEVYHLDQLLLTPRRVARRAGFGSRCDEPFFVVALTDNPRCVPELWPDPWGGGVLQLVTEEGSPEALGVTAAAVRRLRPDALTVKPSLLEAFLALREDGISFSGACGPVISSGANLPAAIRDAAAQRLGVPIIEAYGLTEFGIVASECSAGTGLHLDPDVIVEVLDDNDLPVPEGELGHIVLTSIRNAVMPLLRYRTGDLGATERSPCRCGRATARLVSLAGRTMLNFRLPSGALISPVRFHDLFAAFPVAEFQLTQTGVRRFDLIVQPSDDASLDPAALSAFVHGRLGEPADVVVSIGKIWTRGGKFERYRVSLDDT